VSLNYHSATWRIRIAKNTHIEVSICGLTSDRDSCDASVVVRSASVLREIGRAMDRIAERWQMVERAESLSSDSAGAVKEGRP